MIGLDIQSCPEAIKSEPELMLNALQVSSVGALIEAQTPIKELTLNRTHSIV